MGAPTTAQYNITKGVAVKCFSSLPFFGVQVRNAHPYGGMWCGLLRATKSRPYGINGEWAVSSARTHLVVCIRAVGTPAPTEAPRLRGLSNAHLHPQYCTDYGGAYRG